MSIIGSNILAGASGQAGGAGAYEISRSVRFNSSDSAYLSRVFSSAGNRRTFTYACWVKRNKLGVYSRLFCGGTGTGANFDQLTFINNDTLSFETGSTVWRKTSAVYRDPGAWMHVVLAVDTTQAVPANRAKLYVNGAELTVFIDSSNPIQNYDHAINNNVEHDIGADKYNNTYSYLSDCQLADIHLIDGQALDPTSFGEFDDNGVWQPIDASGLTFGTNGFHLPLSDNSTAAALGTDTSSNGNNWTPNNLSVNTGGPTSVAAASGALPIYNTTDTYGATKGTGTRTDTNSSSIVLAIPMDGANNGTTFTDESATIKGSGSAKTITRNGDSKTSTAQSKFYGSSGYFDGSGDYVEAADSADFTFGSGDFTIEVWANPVALVSNRQASILGQWSNQNDRSWDIACENTGASLKVYGVSLNAYNFSTPLPVGQWTHLALTRSGNTLRAFSNGIQIGSTTISEAIVDSPQTVKLGTNSDSFSQRYFNGYIQDARVYKGVAKYTGNFNPPTSTIIGSVAPGNDSLVDSPVNGSQVDTGVGGEVVGNYATLNPLDLATANTLAPTNGNLEQRVFGGSSTWGSARGGTFTLTSGKWYWECVVRMTFPNNNGPAIIGILQGNLPGSYVTSGANALGVYYQAYLGQKYVNGVSSSYGTSWSNAATDYTLGVALDIDGGTITFYLNGVSQGAITLYSNSNGWKPHFAHNSSYGASEYTDTTWNFGQRPFAYPLSGFKALCTTNLPEPTIADGSTAMDVTLWTGNNASNRVITSSLKHDPDLVWVKARSASGYEHAWFDALRSTNMLASSNTARELDFGGTTPVGGWVTNAGSGTGGFTVTPGSSNAAYVNQTGVTYVGWTWDAGSSTVTNTQGSISSQVRANASAGFSVVTFTGGGTGSTIGHGLGVAPQFLIVKDRGVSSDWCVYHVSTGGGNFTKLNATDASTANTTMWGNAAPISTTFTWGFGSGNNYVAYCFAPVAGYSAYGSYTGNGSADGPFVFTGMRPRWVLIRRTDTTENWILHDTSRDTYNVTTKELIPNSSGAEGSTTPFDILSNGFKLRDAGGGTNGSGGTYIYACFAESPFQYGRAR
jgi:hypothetical protein